MPLIKLADGSTILRCVNDSAAGMQGAHERARQNREGEADPDGTTMLRARRQSALYEVARVGMHNERTMDARLVTVFSCPVCTSVELYEPEAEAEGEDAEEEPAPAPPVRAAVAPAPSAVPPLYAPMSRREKWLRILGPLVLIGAAIVVRQLGAHGFHAAIFETVALWVTMFAWLTRERPTSAAKGDAS